MPAVARKAAAVLLAVIGLATTVGVLTGSLAFVTTHGNSMAPGIMDDDLVIVRRASYEVGDTVAYRSPELRQLVLHRIIAQDGPLYRFQGDNNDFVDSEQLTRDDIVGQQLLHLPGGGRWVRLLGTGLVLGLAPLLLLTSGGGSTVHRRPRRDRRTVADFLEPAAAPTVMPLPSPAAAPSARAALLSRSQELWQRLTDLPDPLLHLTKAVAVIGLVGLILGVPSWSQPTSIEGDTRTVEGTVAFSYSARVTGSDGSVTTVEAPRPVLWPVAEPFQITYDHQGQTGMVTVEAQLATDDGWRSTVQLSDPTPVVDGGDDATLELDLPQLWAHADSAAASRGATLDQLDVSVVTRLSLEGGGEMAGEMALHMDLLSLTFSHVGDATTDPFTAELSTSTTSRAPATLTAVGRTIPVTTARMVSLAAIMLAVLFAAGLAVALRRRGPVAESVRIARRYDALLLPVRPVTTRRERRIIDVASIAPLTKLAEACGVPVLHWSRSGVETYLVEDQDTTYRFRIGDLSTAAPRTDLAWTINLPDGDAEDHELVSRARRRM